jgi:diguanylate cyclase (GGDEF)-like protein
LRNAQRRYVLDLFSGLYDMEYVNNRLRIGLVHKRIGVEPKLYLSAIHTLKGLLHETIGEEYADKQQSDAVIAALDKLLSFDVSLVFDTYIRSLVAEIETAKDKSERYARSMEEKVRERTRQLEEMTRIDALTGLLNVRHLEELVTKTLRSAKRRGEPVAAVYLDVDNFKAINDSLGHQRGDEVLRMIGSTLKNITRIEDSCFRYGGDEFCVILANCREDQAQTIFVDRLNDKLRQGVNPVSLSNGIAQTGPNEYVDAHELIRAADKKMYTAKKAFKASLDVTTD